MISGRAEQLLHLRSGVGRILSAEEGPNTIVLSGEAGIGKTTLLETLTEKLRSSPEPPLVVHAVCSTPLAEHDIGEVEALAPWLQIVAGLATERNESLVGGRTLVGKLALAWVRCIPVVGDVLESAADTALILKGHPRRREQQIASGGLRDQEQMFRQCINLLTAVSSSSPLVVVIDDVHWADNSSTNLLFSAARELAGRPVAFVVAYRPDEAAVSREGEGHPIVRVIGELERYGLVDSVPIPALSSADLPILLRSRYPGYTLQPEFERWLAEISSGNPLFIVQFLTTLEEDGTINRRSGAAGAGYRTVDTPRSAQAVVTERIRRLDPEARDLLRYASVEGETFSTWVLGRISDLGRLKILAILRRIADDHRMIASLGKQSFYGVETTLYRFHHRLIQRALYESLGEEEREVLHEEMLAALNERGEELRERGELVRDLGPRIAVHAEVLGRHREAALALMEGAEGSWTELAVEETLRMVEGAIRNLELARRREPDSRDLLGIEAKARRIVGRIRRYRGDYAGALEEVDRGLEAARGSADPERIVGGLLDRANTLRYLGRLDEAEAEAREGLELARSCGYRAGEAGALNSVGTILYPGGRREEAVACYLQAIDIQREEGDLLGQAQTLSNLGNVFNALGERAEAARCYRRSLDLAAESDNLVSYGVALLHLGNLCHREEDYAAARDYYEQSRELGERIGYRELHIRSLANIASVERAAGRLDRADEIFREVDRVASGWAEERFMADLVLERGALAVEMMKEAPSSKLEALKNEALQYLNGALAYFEAQGDSVQAARVREEIEGMDR